MKTSTKTTVKATTSTASAPSLATAQVTNIAATWITKNGTIKIRESATGALSAPLAVKVSNALQSDLTMWTNGQYRPIIADLRALLSDKQSLNIAQTVALNPKNKPETLAFIGAVLVTMTTKNGEAVEPKGAKLRAVNLLKAIQAYETQKTQPKVDAPTLEIV